MILICDTKNKAGTENKRIWDNRIITFIVPFVAVVLSAGLGDTKGYTTDKGFHAVYKLGMFSLPSWVGRQQP